MFGWALSCCCQEGQQEDWVTAVHGMPLCACSLHQPDIHMTAEDRCTLRAPQQSRKPERTGRAIGNCSLR